MIQTNLALMQQDIGHTYQRYLDQSHHGHPPSVIESIHTGQPVRPSYSIDPEFLQWAYQTRSIASISRFLGISRDSVRNALLAYGIPEPQISPFASQDQSKGESEIPSAEHDFLLDPILPQATPSSSNHNMPRITSFTGSLLAISNTDLDLLIIQLCQQFTRAEITVLRGMLQRLGYWISQECIQQSLYHIDPVHQAAFISATTHILLQGLMHSGITMASMVSLY